MHKLCPECSEFGPDAVKLVRSFATHSNFDDVVVFTFKTYKPTPGVEARIRLGNARSLAALSPAELVSRYPDLDSLVNQMVSGIDVDESIDVIEVRKSDLASQLPQLVKHCHGHREALALYSFCKTASGGVLHIPMMDFRIESGDDVGQLRLLKQGLKKLQQKDGVLLNSGNSYHYYGFKPLPEREWKRFLTACLLLEPLVDVRYISHRMLAGKAALRLTAAPLKDFVPQIEACLH